MGINNIAEELLKTENRREPLSRKDRERHKKANRVFGVLSQLRGEMHEQKAFKACGNKQLWPSYVVAIREPLKVEDEEQKADMVILTKDAGKILVQLKSSEEAARIFLDEYPHLAGYVAVVIVKTEGSLKQLAKKIFKEVSKIRNPRVSGTRV